MERIEYVDRKSGERVVESVMGDGALKFAYETLLGRTLWPVLFGSKLISSLLGRRYDSPRSKKDIVTLANIPGCQPEEAEKPLADYASFNAFFTRRLKPGARPVGEGLVSPADGRLMLYLNADADTPFPLKGARRSLRTVFDRKAPAGRYDIAVIRLAPVDYHRFHFPCDCTTPDPVRVIPGKYHSVNPIALVRYPDVYADNERQILKCQAVFGDFWLVDVGAFGVGTIVQTYSGATHAKGDEKGYFKFGGSTVILILPAGKVTFDADLIANSANGLETRIRCAEPIARFPAVAPSEQKQPLDGRHNSDGVPEGLREEQMQTLIGREFVHFKGGHYRLHGFATDTETGETMVVYESLYGDSPLPNDFGVTKGGPWVRPAKMFFGDVMRDGKTFKRFRLLEERTSA